MGMTVEGIWQHFKLNVRRIKIPLALILITWTGIYHPFWKKKIKRWKMLFSATENNIVLQ